MIEPQLGIKLGIACVDFSPVMGIALGCIIVVALAFWWGKW